jgi:transcription antitermination factor NusG
MNLSTSNSVQSFVKTRIPLNWYVVYTMPHHEKKIYTLLRKEGIDAYLPLYATLKQWSDRKKKVTEPLFRSYLFVRVGLNDYYRVLNIPGVIRYVSFEGKAVIIPESKIEAIKNLLENKFELEEGPANLQKGDKVEIIEGSLKGLTGELVIINNQKRVIIRIEEINKSLFVNVPVGLLKLVA